MNGINFLDRLEARHEVGTAIVLLVLVQVEGTPLAGQPTLDRLDFVRTFAVARICIPASVVRLSAGREDMSDETASRPIRACSTRSANMSSVARATVSGARLQRQGTS